MGYQTQKYKLAFLNKKSNNLKVAIEEKNSDNKQLQLRRNSINIFGVLYDSGWKISRETV